MDAILNKVPTKERIKNWGLEVNDVCELCGREGETRDHLFYGCRFSQQAWNEILILCGQTRRCTSWRGELEWTMQRLKGKSLTSTILRIAWQSVIYYTWKERNQRIHNGKMGTVMQTVEQIKIY